MFICKRNRDPDEDGLVLLTCENILTPLNRALASSGWPENYAAILSSRTCDSDPDGSALESKKHDKKGDVSDTDSDSNTVTASSILPNHAASPMVERCLFWSSVSISPSLKT